MIYLVVHKKETRSHGDPLNKEYVLLTDKGIYSEEYGSPSGYFTDEDKAKNFLDFCNESYCGHYTILKLEEMR